MSLTSLGFDGDSTLSNSGVERYSAHLLLPQIGAAGYKTLQQKQILVIGAGGLGCSCIAYLAAQGCACLGIVDGDVICRSNLARQVLHSTGSIGGLKVDSVKSRCADINPDLQVKTYPIFIDASNAPEILSAYDVICDCTDNLPARLLLSDWCVVLSKPLVSAAAVRWEGHLTVYNYPFTHHKAEGEIAGLQNALHESVTCSRHTSGCYRCLAPQTLTCGQTECSQSCSEAGVIGGIVGMLGSMQAIEALKIAVNMKNGVCHCTGSSITPIRSAEGVLAGRMFYYNALRGTSRVFTLAPRKPSCVTCGEDGIIEKVASERNNDKWLTEAEFHAHVTNYARELIGSYSTCDIQKTKEGPYCEHVIHPVELFKRLYFPASGENPSELSPCVLLDVRSAQEVAMCRLPVACTGFIAAFTVLYIPIEDVPDNIDKIRETQGESGQTPVFVLCRRGRRSGVVTNQLQEQFGMRSVYNVAGGLHAWRKDVDASFPFY